MVVRLAAEDASENLSALLCRVRHGGETVILEEAGKPMAAVIPLEQYEKMMREREARFAIIDKIRDAVPDYPEDEIDADIAEAVGYARMRSVERRR